MSPTDPESLVGQTIETYHLDALLGMGGMGAVFLATDKDEHHVAVKILMPPVLISSAQREEFRKRFLREAQTLSRLRHPHILPVSAFGTTEKTGFVYMIMPYMRGGTLAERIRPIGLPFPLVATYVQQIADALDYAHEQNIIHRDLKPANVLLDEHDQLYLADFGIAKLFDINTTTLTSVNQAVGTPAYMAPEQIANKSVNSATDVYGLATLTYQLITGSLPFDASALLALLQQIAHTEPPDPCERRPDLSPEAAYVIRRGLAKAPEARFQGAKAFALALAEGLQVFSQAIPAQVTSLSEENIPTEQLGQQMHNAAVNGDDLTTLPGRPHQAIQRPGTDSRQTPFYPQPPAEAPVDADIAVHQPTNEQRFVSHASYTTNPPQTPPPQPVVSTSNSGPVSIPPMTPAMQTGYTTNPPQTPLSQPMVSTSNSGPMSIPPVTPAMQTGYTTNPPQTPLSQPMVSTSNSGPVSIPPMTPPAQAIPLSNPGLTPAPSFATFVPPPIGRTTPNTPGPRKRHRALGIIVALVVVLLLAGSGSFFFFFLRPSGAIGTSAHNPPTHTPSGTHGHNPPTITPFSALVMITPDSQKLQKTFVMAETPRTISVTTQTQTQTASATGVQNNSATQATGQMTFEWLGSSGCAPSAGTVFTGKDGVQVVIDQTPDSSQTTSTVPAHAVQAGSIGNIPANDINQSDPVCTDLVEYNSAPFSGGQDTQYYKYVKQSDIDSAENTLINSSKPDARQVVQGQLQSNERIIGTPSCSPNASADHVAGDRVSSFTVTVSFTCTGQAYDLAGAEQAATQQLQNQASSNPGSAYTLTGTIATTFESDSMTNGTVNVTIATSGTWTFQLSDAQKQDWAKSLVGKTKDAAQAFLTAQTGVKQVSIQLPDGDTTLPTDTSKIIIEASS